jgi:hypothetical protein
VCVATALAVVPAAAAAANTYYVNGATGNDTYNCLAPTGTGPAGPCSTVGGAVTKATADAQSGDQILVADGTYAESVTLTNQMVLSSSDGDTDPKPVVNGSTVITGSGASIDHLELKGWPLSLHIQGTGPTSITGNKFSETTDMSQDVLVQNASGAVTVSGNTFTDDGAGTVQTAIGTQSASPNVSIEGNTVSGLQTGIWAVNGVAPAIRGNDISGTHDSGIGISVYGGSPEITANTIHTPAPTNFPTGIYVAGTNPPTGATLRRNRIFGYTYGVLAVDTDLPLTLNGDLIAGSQQSGLQAIDSASPGGGDVSATNVTIFDGVLTDVKANEALVTLNSSIVGLPVTKTAGGSCAISFSRGAAIGTPGDLTDCNDFQTVTDPLFLSPGSSGVPGSNYRLQAGSPMIDAGDPASPAGALDNDGNPFGLASTPSCAQTAGRRDIGAYEFVPATGVGCPPPATAAPPKKKCKKGRKLVKKHGKKKCVKRKRRK